MSIPDPLPDPDLDRLARAAEAHAAGEPRPWRATMEAERAWAERLQRDPGEEALRAELADRRRVRRWEWAIVAAIVAAVLVGGHALAVLAENHPHLTQQEQR